MGATAADRDPRDVGGAHDAQADPVADPEVVLGHGPSRPHREVEAGGPPVEALAGAEVAGPVDHEDDQRVLVTVGRGDVERPGAQRHRPVDPAESVADLEGPEPVELAPAAGTGGPV